MTAGCYSGTAGTGRDEQMLDRLQEFGSYRLPKWGLMASAMSLQLGKHEVLARRWSEPWADVVVLERLARGGGGTRWFMVRSAEEVREVYDELRAGSRVSFYFDGGVHISQDDEGTRQQMFDEVTSTGEIILGYPNEADVVLNMDIISGPSELTEHLIHHTGGERIVWGTLPAPLNDGHKAVTVDLVDADGMLRTHPH
ncbi:hypothetical protein [Kribbella swartbergensis]